FNRELLDFSTEFILKNPMQIRKSLDARVAIKEPAIRVITARSGESGEAGLREALNSIQERGNGHGGDVLLIGRYRHNNPDWSSLRASYPTLNLNFMTAHSSKGREADYAIVLDVISGKYGFPSEIVDDPILNLVLSNDSAFLNAEERRLFYVAVTRAKNIAFLITHETKKSSFIEEIEGPEYEHFVSSDKMSCGAIRCSKCGGGFLIKRKAGSRSFWGCSNYPYCDAISEVCFTCKEGVMIKNNRAFICSRTACGETAPICPRCGQGMLIVKDGKYGPFLGCTNWRSKGASCKYTQKLSK
ncbi:MAG: hypothetical protein GYA36_18260, partial [Veillonellaceae bacterium]|nr:hypothetical protein [Veillonellaceae bacterium]